MSLAPGGYGRGQPTRVFSTPEDLGGPTGLGTVALVLDPLTIYAYTETGWQPLASLSGATLPSVGNHNLFSSTHPDVGGIRDDGDVLVWRPSQGTSGLYDHDAVANLLANATEAQSGQEELARAVAVTAYERGERGIFNRWAEANPERAAAIERIKGTPGAEQLYTRTTRTMRPPRANLEDLQPTHEDRRRAREAEEAKNRPREEFFGPSVRRQVGSRMA